MTQAPAIPDQSLQLSSDEEMLSRSTPRLGKSALALSDQAVVSLGNFLTNILLANHLQVAQYGTFSLLLNLIWFLNGLHAALVVYPLSVRGAISDRSRLQRLSRICLLMTIVLAIPMSIAMGIGATVLAGASNEPKVLAVFAVVALVLWQIQETFRRALISHLLYKQAVIGDAIRYLGQAAILLVLQLTGHLSLSAALLSIAVTSLIAAIVQCSAVGLRRINLFRLPKVMGDFWRLGRWLLLGNLTGLITLLAANWVLAWRHSLAEAGQLLALANLVNLANPVMFGIIGLIVPAVAHARASRGWLGARHVALHYAGLGALLVIPFFAIMLLYPRFTLGLFYRDATLLSLEGQLQIYAVYGAFNYIAAVTGAVLEGLEQARHSFDGRVVHTLCATFIGIPLIIVLGLNGAIIGSLIGALVLTATYVYYLSRTSFK